MMMSLGPVTFDLVTNLQTHESEHVQSFAKHDVIGASPIYEDTGGDESPFTIDVVLHPEHFGGMGALEALKRSADTRLPLPLMRGDFWPLGWYLIQSVQETHGEINSAGIGREIECSISLIRAGNPGIGMASQILRLFT